MSHVASLDKAAHLAAIAAAVNAVLPVTCRAYMMDDLAALDPRPDEYVELRLYERPTETPLACGTSDCGHWRLTALCVSRWFATNVDVSLTGVRRALEHRTVTVEGRTSTPLQLEPGSAVAPDDGWWSSLTTFTYVL